MERDHPHRLSAVLFDAVGTLIALREPVGATYARFAAASGLRLDSKIVQTEFARLIRARRAPVFPRRSEADRVELERVWWRELVCDVMKAAAAQSLPASFDDVFARLFAHYGSAAAWAVAPGARQLLEELRAAGLRLAVVSNFDHRLREVLRQLGLAPCFDAIVLPGEAGAAKPDAAIFELALRRLAVRADAALYVGDDPEEDIAAAHAAGLATVHIGSENNFDTVRRAVALRNRR